MKKLAEFDLKDFKIDNQKGLLFTMIVTILLMVIMMVANCVEYGKTVQWWAPFFTVIDNIKMFLDEANAIYTNPILQFVLPKLNIDPTVLDIMMNNISTINYILDTLVFLVKFMLWAVLLIKIIVYIEVFITVIVSYFNMKKERIAKAYKKINVAAFIAFIYGMTPLVLTPEAAFTSILMMLVGGVLMYFNDQVNRPSYLKEKSFDN